MQELDYYLIKNVQDRPNWASLEDVLTEHYKSVSEWSIIGFEKGLNLIDDKIWNKEEVDYMLESKYFKSGSNKDIFKIYKYLTEQKRAEYKNPTMPPHSIEYKKDIEGKFNPIQKKEETFLVSSVYKAWDYQNNVEIEEILKVLEDYTVDDNTSLYNSTKTVLSRLKTRNWTNIEGEYIDEFKMIRPKVYDTFDKQNLEGTKRRKNAKQSLLLEYILLRIFQLGESEQEAQSQGFSFLQNYSTLISDFITGSSAIHDAVENDNDSFLNMVIANNVVSQQGFTMVDVYPSYTPTLKKENIADYVGLKVKDRLNDLLKGNI